MIKKKCTKCGEIKPICGFRIRKDTGKYRGSCLACDRVYFAARAEKLRDKHKAYRKNYYSENAATIKERVHVWK